MMLTRVSNASSIWSVCVVGQFSAIQINCQIIDDSLLLVDWQPVQRVLRDPIVGAILGGCRVRAPSAVTSAKGSGNIWACQNQE